MFKEALTAIVKPVGDFFTARERRKEAKTTGLHKIEQAKIDAQNSLDLTDAEWEAITAKGGEDSWKDEYAIITMTSWIWVAMYGALKSDEILARVQVFLDFCTANGVEVGVLTSMVIGAAVGLKVWRGR